MEERALDLDAFDHSGVKHSEEADVAEGGLVDDDVLDHDAAVGQHGGVSGIAADAEEAAAERMLLTSDGGPEVVLHVIAAFLIMQIDAVEVVRVCLSAVDAVHHADEPGQTVLGVDVYIAVVGGDEAGTRRAGSIVVVVVVNSASGGLRVDMVDPAGAGREVGRHRRVEGVDDIGRGGLVVRVEVPHGEALAGGRVGVEGDHLAVAEVSLIQVEFSVGVAGADAAESLLRPDDGSEVRALEVAGDAGGVLGVDVRVGSLARTVGHAAFGIALGVGDGHRLAGLTLESLGGGDGVGHRRAGVVAHIHVSQRDDIAVGHVAALGLRHIGGSLDGVGSTGLGPGDAVGREAAAEAVDEGVGAGRAAGEHVVVVGQDGILTEHSVVLIAERGAAVVVETTAVEGLAVAIVELVGAIVVEELLGEGLLQEAAVGEVGLDHRHGVADRLAGEPLADTHMGAFGQLAAEANHRVVAVVELVGLVLAEGLLEAFAAEEDVGLLERGDGLFVNHAARAGLVAIVGEGLIFPILGASGQQIVGVGDDGAATGGAEFNHALVGLYGTEERMQVGGLAGGVEVVLDGDIVVQQQGGSVDQSDGTGIVGGLVIVVAHHGAARERQRGALFHEEDGCGGSHGVEHLLVGSRLSGIPHLADAATVEGDIEGREAGTVGDAEHVVAVGAALAGEVAVVTRVADHGHAGHVDAAHHRVAVDHHLVDDGEDVAFLIDLVIVEGLFEALEVEAGAFALVLVQHGGSLGVIVVKGDAAAGHLVGGGHEDGVASGAQLDIEGVEETALVDVALIVGIVEDDATGEAVGEHHRAVEVELIVDGGGGTAVEGSQEVAAVVVAQG